MPAAAPLPSFARRVALVWLDGSHGPEPNMARDVELLEAVAADPGAGPLVRVYGFDPPGITLGRGQVPERELDLAALSLAGVPWAVRPTGGGAIWHEQAWTVSIAARLGPDGWAATPKRAVARTGALLAAALRSLGVPAECWSGAERLPAAAGRPGAGPPPCFAATSGHEVVVGKRKLAGIAQRVRGRAFLQQVNLLLGDAHARIARHLSGVGPDRDALERDYAARAVGAGAWLGDDTGLERLAGALLEGLRAAFGEARLVRGPLPPVPLATGESAPVGVRLPGRGRAPYTAMKP
jgi:lipoate-protein ligase A